MRISLSKLYQSINKRISVDRDVDKHDQGSIMFIVLIFMMLLSGAVYHYCASYRELARNYLGYARWEEGFNAIYSLEDTLCELIPRVNISVYKALHGIPLSSPLEKKFPFKEGVAEIKLASLNNCINLQIKGPDPQASLTALEPVLSGLADETGRDKRMATDLYGALSISMTQQSTDIGSNLLSDPVKLSAQEKKALRSALPFLCRRDKPGQRININAISLSRLPVLAVIVSGSIPAEKLRQYWKSHPHVFWKNTDDFFDAFQVKASVPDSVRGALVTEDNEMLLDISFKDSENTQIFSESHIALDKGKASVLSRRLYKEDGINE